MSSAEMLTRVRKGKCPATIIGNEDSGPATSRTAIRLGYGDRLVLPVGAYQNGKGVASRATGIDPM